MSTRALQKRIRELEEERDFLRECLWLANGGKYPKAQTIKINVIPFEEVAKSPQDGFLRALLE